MARQFVAASSEYYEYADNAAIKSGSGDFSIFLRLYFDSLGASSVEVFNKGNASGAPFGGVRYQLFSNEDAMGFACDDNGTKAQADWIATIPTGSWMNIVCTRTGSTATLYEDATQRGTETDPTLGSIDTTSTLVFGAGRNDGDTIVNFANCRIADFAYLDRLPTSSEISAFNEGFEPPLDRSAWIPFVRGTQELMVPIALSNTGGTPVVVPHPSIHRRSSGILQFPPASAPPPAVTDVDTDEAWDDGDTGLVATGTGFV